MLTPTTPFPEVRDPRLTVKELATSRIETVLKDLASLVAIVSYNDAAQGHCVAAMGLMTKALKEVNSR